MKRYGLALVVALAFASLSCASAPKAQPPAAPDKAPITSHVMSLLGRFSAAHACPVGEHLALTASHVLDPMPQSSIPLQAYRWTDHDGGAGLLLPPTNGLMPGADIGYLISVAPLAHWYQRAQIAPIPGDKLWLVQYSWASEERAFSDEPLEVEVLRVTAGSVVYKPAGLPGSSGSCVLNESGELVAINVWGFAVGRLGLTEVGVGAGVWGPWFPKMEEE